MAHPGVGDDRGAAGGGGRLPAALARPDADQGQGRHAHLLAPRQRRVRQTVTHAASSRVSVLVCRRHSLSNYCLQKNMLNIEIISLLNI